MHHGPHRLVWLAILVAIVACHQDEPVSPDPPSPSVGTRTQESETPPNVAEPGDKPREDGLASTADTADGTLEDPPELGRSWTRPVIENGTGDPSGGREVELSMNGERVRVWRPSTANPFVVAGGEFQSEPISVSAQQDPSDRLRLHSTRAGTIDIIRRVPQTLALVVESDDGVGGIMGYLVQFEGYPGHFFVPAQTDNELYGSGVFERGRVEIGFFMDEVFPPGVDRDAQWAAGYDQPFDVSMTIRAVDRFHRVSNPVSQMLHVLPVGRGDLEVTLSMNLPSDLDLYVVEPNGNVIYYNNMRSWTNGRLDLDANAACRANRNVRYEHIFWPEGGVPAGTYQIRVDNWANCVSGQAVDFQVIVQNCGDITIYEGSAVGPGGRDDCVYANSPSCQHIATIDVKECLVPPPVGN